MYLKIHHSPGAGDVVAVCDRELLNTTITKGDIEVNISEKFYGTTTASVEEVRKALKTATNANLMGKQAVTIAVELGLIESSSCSRIGNVPHALVFKI